MSKAKQRVIEVEIYDQKYSIILKSAMEEADVRRVADELDVRMREISAASNTADSLRVAILTALHLAQENNEFVRKADDWIRTLDQLFKR
ncbi:MAG: cell division protein ZapA [Acidobacteria bacterium]|nr:cell division protein ZapA [Acidobacteriota bacterium]